jgi:hypothetical protein
MAMSKLSKSFTGLPFCVHKHQFVSKVNITNKVDASEFDKAEVDKMKRIKLGLNF